MYELPESFPADALEPVERIGAVGSVAIIDHERLPAHK